MTAKEKAEELILKFLRLQEPNYNWFNIHLAKKCALIAVDEVMSVITVVPYGITYLSLVGYWEEVREEIEKL